jgi:hypothetical protein
VNRQLAGDGSFETAGETSRAVGAGVNASIRATVLSRGASGLAQETSKPSPERQTNTLKIMQIYAR